MAYFPGMGSVLLPVLVGMITLRLVKVRRVRYERARKIESEFGWPTRPLSTMTTKEAYTIMNTLQRLEFPFAMHKGVQTALLKTGAIPSMTRLFAATGQSTPQHAAKRAIDTEILIREVQSQDPESYRYMASVARMNYLHSHYRKAGKILDEDMLRTLGASVLEMFRCVDKYEWRRLTDVEKCAIGMTHRLLGEDMQIPFDALPSYAEGWQDGQAFAEELCDFCEKFEQEKGYQAPSNIAFVDVHFEAKTAMVPQAIKPLLRKIIAIDLDSHMRHCLGLPDPGALLSVFVQSIYIVRRYYLRYFCLPRPDHRAKNMVPKNANPLTGLYNVNHGGFEPWYVSSERKVKGLQAYMRRVFGAPVIAKEFYNGGYDLLSLGPKRKEGKGVNEMDATIESLKTTSRTGCPFALSADVNAQHRQTFAQEPRL